MKLHYQRIEQILSDPNTKTLLDKCTGLLSALLPMAIDKLQAKFKYYVTAMQKIQDGYAEKDGDGKVKSVQQGNFTIVDFGTNVEVASKEIRELQDTEIEINIEPINYDPEAERNKDITGSEILAVLPLLNIKK